jgi:hydroxymethylglutaryl-CoA lyase
MLKIVEVAPRDGLQNETATVPTNAKVSFVNALSETGVGEIEVSAFVSPRKVPQLGDAEDVFHKIRRNNRVVYSALVPNSKGLDRAVSAQVNKISLFTSASETFNLKNINSSVDDSLKVFQSLIKRARAMGIPVRGYISTAFWCAFEGKIAPQAVVDLAQALIEIGVDEVSISDTIGKATPEEVEQLLDVLLLKVSPASIAVHFHDTYGRGVANVLKSVSYGIRIIDASAGGLGGCPFAPGATGNVSTESVVEALENQGVDVGVDLKKLVYARGLLNPFLLKERRIMPKRTSLACSVCEFLRGEVCCRTETDEEVS